MAAPDYSEYTHSASPKVPDWNMIDPLYKWDTHFPQRLSRLKLSEEFSPRGGRRKRGRARNSVRFKTQPITFDEIKEVDEETVDDKQGLKTQFTAFSRSMDGLLPGLPHVKSADAVVQVETDSSQKLETPAQDSSGQTSEEHAKKKDNISASDSSSVSASGQSLPAGLPGHDPSRARRLRRRHKRRSIEEEPELEKKETTTSESVG